MPVSKSTREKISALDFEVVADYLKKCGWRKGGYEPKDGCFSLWYKEFWSDDESNRVRNDKRVDEVELMLPHFKHYRDYGNRMQEVLYNLSLVNDKCECEILNEILNK